MVPVFLPHVLVVYHTDTNLTHPKSRLGARWWEACSSRKHFISDSRAWESWAIGRGSFNRCQPGLCSRAPDFLEEKPSFHCPLSRRSSPFPQNPKDQGIKTSEVVIQNFGDDYTSQNVMTALDHPPESGLQASAHFPQCRIPEDFRSPWSPFLGHGKSSFSWRAYVEWVVLLSLSSHLFASVSPK